MGESNMTDTKHKSVRAVKSKGKQRAILVLRSLTDTTDDKRGRRNKEFPTLNIRATAVNMGVTESHLARLLTLKNRPSMRLARLLADGFGLTLEQVERIYDRRNRQRFQLPG